MLSDARIEEGAPSTSQILNINNFKRPLRSESLKACEFVQNGVLDGGALISSATVFTGRTTWRLALPLQENPCRPQLIWMEGGQDVVY